MVDVDDRRPGEPGGVRGCDRPDPLEGRGITDDRDISRTGRLRYDLIEPRKERVERRRLVGADDLVLLAQAFRDQADGEGGAERVRIRVLVAQRRNPSGTAERAGDSPERTVITHLLDFHGNHLTPHST